MWPFDASDRRRRFEREALPHLDACYRFALALARDHAEADDLVQETMIRAYRAFDSYAEGTRCKAWLFRILKNVFLNRRRTDGREVDLEESLGAIQDLGWEDRPFYRSPEDAAILAATRDRIEEALRRMPRDFREAVVLADVEGLSYQEIAEVMGTPIGTVMSRIHRGRRMLRALLSESLGLGQEAQREPAGETADPEPGRVIPWVASREGGHGL